MDTHTSRYNLLEMFIFLLLRFNVMHTRTSGYNFLEIFNSLKLQNLDMEHVLTCFS